MQSYALPWCMTSCRILSYRIMSHAFFGFSPCVIRHPLIVTATGTTSCGGGGVNGGSRSNYRDGGSGGSGGGGKA